ncbi:hypothetical protein CDL15_Pgr000052 [Punica granatum]|uniref:Uncharacterized protein n=1 Tax=Punica granatum TaxID=22663 RepID=A0A218VPX0_PUNGR|nr:hypothetical protein CDL15_Pgr000052 [Punica granatum]
MVGAANSDSARISFFGSTKGELAQKLDRGQDAVGRRRLTQLKCPPNRAKWSPITRLTNSAWGGDTYYSSAVRRTPTHNKDAATSRRNFFQHLESPLSLSASSQEWTSSSSADKSRPSFIISLAKVE